MLKRILVSAAIALAVLAPAQALAAPAEDACDLLRRADIGQVFDARVGRPEEGDLFPDCEWKVTGFGTVRTTYEREGSGEAYDAAVSIGAALGDDSVKDTPLRNLGIRALRRDGDLVTVYMLTSDAFFSVQADFPSFADSTGDARADLDNQVKRLARRAEPRA